MSRFPRLLALLTVPALLLGLVATVPAAATRGAAWQDSGTLPTSASPDVVWLRDGTAVAVAAGATTVDAWTRPGGEVGSEWAPAVLPAPGAGITPTGDATVAASPQGEALAVVAVNLTVGGVPTSSLAGYRRSPTGGWSYLGLANPPASPVVAYARPVVVASPAGGFVVVGSSSAGDTLVSWRVPAGATAWPTAVTGGLADTDWSTLGDRSLAVGIDGTAYLATLLRSTPAVVSLLRLDPGATDWSPPLTLSGQFPTALQPQVVMGGAPGAPQPVVVFKSDTGGGSWQLTGVVAPGTWNGQVGGSVATIGDLPPDPAPADVPVALAAAPSGVVSVAWTRPVAGGTQVAVALVDPASDVPAWDRGDATLRQPPTSIRDLALTASGSAADGWFTLVWTGPAPSSGGVQVGSQWWEDRSSYTPEVTTVLASGIDLAGGPALSAAGGPDGSVVALARLASPDVAVFEDIAPRPAPVSLPSLRPEVAPRVSVPAQCDPGEWERRLATTYRWLRNGALISGATSATYVPKVTDLGATLQCRVAASSAAGTTTVASVGRTVLAGPSADAISRPRITGTPAVGSRLTCSKGTWKNQVTLTFGVSWKRGTTTIAGATRFTYTPVRADKGKKITCRVTAARTGYQTGAASSTAVTIR